MKKKYALLGHPLSHSLSPQIHELLFAYSEIDASYTLAQIPPEEFPTRVNELFSLDGFNITIPYKLKIMQYLSDISPQALELNSVNTVVCGGENSGHNTDVFGFVSAVEQMGISFRDKKVLLLGSGGSANMIGAQAVLNNCSLTIAVRAESLHKAHELKSRLLKITSEANISTCSLDDVSGNHDILVNATPVGMYPNVGYTPVSDEVISRCDFVYDLIYNPLETKLLQIAKSQNKIYSNGLSMLVLQAAHAHDIWYGGKFSSEQIREIISQMSKILQGKVQ